MWDLQIKKIGSEDEICRTEFSLLGHCIKLYWMDTMGLTDAAAYDAAYQVLPRWRRDRADFYLKASDKRLSVGAGLLLQRGLAECGASGSDAAIALGPYGKPYLPNRPEISFNLSHAGSLSVAVFADTDVGCDVERIEQADMALAKKFFCAGEYECLMRLPEGEIRDTAFYRFWTLKESFAKATGFGLGKLPLDAFEITLSSDGAANIRQQVDEASYNFWGRCCDGMCIGVCVRAE